MSVFSKIIKEFDGSGDLLEAQREALETLEQLAGSRADGFASDIKLLLAGAGQGVDQTVKISKIFDQKKDARAYSSTSSGDIAKTVGDILSSFLQGETNSIIDGIKKLISGALQVFLGESTGASQTHVDYFLYCSPFMVYRVDWMAWYRLVTAKAIQTKVSKATSFAYSLSSVDVKALEWFDFIGIYGLQLAAEKLTPEQIKQAKIDMKEAWEFMGGKTGEEPEALPDTQNHPHAASVALISQQSKAVSGD